MKEPVTVRHIADRAGVSTATVSRALRNDPRISAETRVAVHRAAEAMNYRRLRAPSLGSESRAVLEGKRVSILLLGLDKSLEALPSVAMALQGLTESLSLAGATTLLHDISDPGKVPPSLRDEPADGLIIRASSQGDILSALPAHALSALRRLPTVWLLGRPMGATWGDGVLTNNWALGEIAAQYLAQCGHRNVASLLAKPQHYHINQLNLAFATVATRLGVHATIIEGREQPPYPQRPVEDIGAVADLVDRALSASPRPTALFCPPDSLARLVYRVLAERGLRIPEDISVISTNNEAAANALLTPPMTTVDLMLGLAGKKAVAQLAWRLEHRNEPPVDVSLLPRLVEGLSVKDVNAGNSNRR